MAEAVEEHVALEGGVAGEQLVGALAGDDAAVAGVPDPFRHEVLGDPEGVVEGALGVPDGVDVVLAVEVGGLEVDHLLVGVHGLGHLAGDGGLVVVVVVEGDRVGLGGRLHRAGGEPEDAARVDAAGEVAADRHVGLEPEDDGADEFVADALDVFLVVELGGRVPPPGGNRSPSSGAVWMSSRPPRLRMRRKWPGSRETTSSKALMPGAIVCMSWCRAAFGSRRAGTSRVGEHGLGLRAVDDACRCPGETQ